MVQSIVSALSILFILTPQLLYAQDNGQPTNLKKQAQEKRQRMLRNKVHAGRQVLISFGPAYFSKMNAPQSGLDFQAGYVWNVDDRFDLLLKSQFAVSTEHSDVYFAKATIGVDYFLLDNDISPYLGASLGYGFASVHDANNLFAISDDTAAGFAMSLRAGFKFFRTSSVNLMVGGEYSTLFNETSLGNPSVTSFKVGLLF